MLFKQEASWASVYLTMVIYWITNALPIALTSFIPVFTFPLLGIMSTDGICSSYMNEANILFLATYFVVLAFRQSKLDERLIMKFLLLFGTIYVFHALFSIFKLF